MDITVLVWIAFYAVLLILAIITQILLAVSHLWMWYPLPLYVVVSPLLLIAGIIAFMFMYAYGWWHAIKKTICGGASWVSR